MKKQLENMKDYTMFTLNKCTTKLSFLLMKMTEYPNNKIYLSELSFYLSQ